MAQAAIDVGSVVAGTFEVTGLLGEGGMGAVWAARHLRLRGKKVAIKLMHAMIASDTEAMARFEREAQIASQLGHPNIVKVEDFNRMADGTAYLVLEFLEGESLADRLSRGPLPLAQALSMARQIGSALQAAHNADIVHRDLKPHNIFLSPSEAGGYATEQVKVLDFGISKIHGSETVKTQTHAILGTPQYMSPEQAKGEHKDIDGRTDQFALGAIVYEMLTGGAAFGGSSIPEVMFKVVYEEPQTLAERVPMTPRPVITAVERALAKERDDRFPTVSAFIEALTGDPLTTISGGPATAAMASPHMSPSLAALAASQVANAATMASQSGPNQAGTAPTNASAAVTPAHSAPAHSAPAHSAPAHSTPAHSTPAHSAPAMPAHPGHYPVADTTPDVAPSTAAIPVQARTNRLLPIFLGLCVLAIVGGLVIVFGLADNSTTEQPPTQSGDVAANASGNSDGDPSAAVPASADAGAAVAAITVADAGNAAGATIPTAGDANTGAVTDNTPNPTTDPASTSSGNGDRTPADSRVPPKLARELKALDRLVEKNPIQAIRQARDYLGAQETRYPRSVTKRARAIMARAYCAKGDLGGARAAMNGLRGRSRSQVIRFCKRHNLDLR